MSKLVSFALIALCISFSTQSAMSQKSKERLVGPLQAVQADTEKSTRFGNISAYSDGKAVWLSWQMDVEVGNIGFNVYRVSRRGGAELLTPVRMVPGAAIHAREIPQYGETYNYYDDQFGTASSAYYVESLALSGAKVATQQIYPIYVPDLSVATGLSREEMQRGTFRPTTLENNLPIFTKDIISEMEEYRQFADSAVHRAVISQAGVVRIGVKRDGLYRVPRAQLQAAGFDVNSDSSLWQLYVEGVEQAIIVGNNADYIEFYGTGIDTIESDIRRYYLMRGATPGKRMEMRSVRPTASTVLTPSYIQTFVKKERVQFVEDIFNGDASNYFGRGIGSNPNAAPMTFNLSGVDFTRPTATMQLRFQGYSSGVHSIEVTLNGAVLAPAPGTDLQSFTADYSIPTSFLREGANSIKFRAGGPTGDFVFFDTMSITFGRKFLADQNSVNFYTQSYRVARLEGFTSPNVRVFDLTHDGNPAVMTNLAFQQSGSTFGADIPAARGRSFFAVEDSAVLAPESVTANNPELVSVPTNSFNMIIISYKDFMTQAEAWAEYRRSQGYTVKVIEVTELFDEFNYGVLSSDSIKNFLQYAYQNWQIPPQYVLLVGDASWDPRNYENQGFWDLVPTKMVTTVYSETASDDALADFDGNGLAEMAVGRVPARTVAEVTTVFTKTVNWESSLTPTSLDRGALFAHDNNNGYDFSGMNLRLRNQLPLSMPSTFVARSEANANTNLINAMGTGKYIVNYSGHGSAGSWGGNPLFFNVGSVGLPVDHSPGVYTMLTCLNGYFHWLYFPSIAEVLLLSPNRGAAVAWASTGLTLPNIQEAMATRFYMKLGEGNIPRMGDLVRDAKSVLPPQSDVRYSWALLGDPLLKVR